jgi:hypothetical protein
VDPKYYISDCGSTVYGGGGGSWDSCRGGEVFCGGLEVSSGGIGGRSFCKELDPFGEDGL